MTDGVLIHREQVPAAGTWNIRPAALSGITPKAFLVLSANTSVDALVQIDQHANVSIGTSAGSISNSQTSKDGVGTTTTRFSQKLGALVRIVNETGTVLCDVDTVSLVSGGIDCTVQTDTSRPTLIIVFFYGANFDAAFSTQTGSISAINIATGLTNTNQLAIFLPSRDTVPGDNNTNNRSSASYGVAVKAPAGGAPASQAVFGLLSRNARSSGTLFGSGGDNRCLSMLLINSVETTYECTDFSNNNLTLTPRVAGNTGFHVLVIGSDNFKFFSGIVNSLTASGTFTVSGMGFQPGFVGLVGTENVNNDADVTQSTDLGIIGLGVADDSSEASAASSEQDGAATTVAKQIQEARFVNFLQQDGSEGWISTAAPTFNADGFSVPLTVDGGGGGSPATIRKWLVWAIEGAAGPPPAITGTGALEAQSAAVSGAGDVIAPTVVTGTGALQAQDAAVSGVGEVIGAIAGTGVLQAQSAQVSGIGAIVHDGAGTLQAQDAAVVGVGEVGNVRTGTGTLQADEAAVVGTGIRVSIGSGALQAQEASVSGAGVVEGLTSGTGVLQAQSAAVSGVGHLVRVGSGSLQAQSAQVAGIGAILGELTLSPADIAAIADAVYAKLVSEGLVQQINEVWQRRGLDPANPQTYDKAGNEIRVGNITIDLSGDPSSVTQTRQP